MMHRPPYVRGRSAKWRTASLAAGLAVALVSACSSDGISLDDPNRVPIGADAGPVPDGSSLCLAPSPGCACAPGTQPVDCYLDPITVGDQITCRAGTQYCRAGIWSACESVVDFSLPGGPSALLTGPTACNPCDPRCFGYVDRPGPGDLTPGNSGNVTYDTTGGGISLTPSMPMSMIPTLPDTDGDGIPDVFDRCVGPGAFADSTGACYGSTFFYHLLPYGGAAVIDPLPITIQIRTADVYFLMDTTGSMGGELARLRTDLTTGNFHPTDATCGNGVVGAIRCAIPDAWFGVGFFEDYPVNPYGGYSSGNGRFDLVYRNVLDITSSLPATQTAINSLTINWGNDGPESNTQGLWAVASGGGLGTYLAPRTGCAAGRWGYPCFRDGTIPIVIHVTDAPFHNGPAGAYPYTGLGWGGGATGVTGNETIANAYAVGAVPVWAEFTGSTAAMANDYDGSCASAGARDAVYSFTVAASTSVTLRTNGSGYDTSIALYRSTTPPPTAVAGNESFGTAYTVPSVTTASVFTGSTAGMANDTGSGLCGSTTAPDAMYRFVLGSATTVSFDTVGSGYDTMLSLWRQRAIDAAVTGNEAITVAPYDVGAISAATIRTYSGTTMGMAHNHSAATCGSVVAPDSAFHFSLASTQTIELSTEGSGYNTVLSLYSRGGTAVAGNDTQATAYNATAAFGTDRTFTGSTAALANDFTGDTCGSGARDAVYRINVAATGTLDVDTVGSSFDTILSLWQAGASTPTSGTATGNDLIASARALGVIGAGYDGTYTGTTTPLVNNYTNACDSAGSGNAPDAVFSFTLASTQTVTMSLAGTSFDSVIQLRDSGGASIQCNDDTIGDDGVITRTLAAGTYYVIVDAFSTGLNGAYQLQVTVPAALTNIACDDDGAGGTASSLVRSLPPGTYYLVVDGFGTANGNYVLNFGNGEYNQIACDNDGIAAGGASRLVRSLGAGDYWVVVDGFGSAAGAYQLNFGPGGPLSNIACNDDFAGLGAASRITTALTAGTYYIGVDGFGGASGPYQLNFGTAASATLVTCNDDGPTPPTSQITQTLSPGTYYAVVDGRGAASGAYRLGIGTTPPTMTLPPSGPVSWDETIAALTARDVRVITLQTCGSWGNAYCLEGESHAHALAYATDSVDGTGSPYSFRGAADGSGLSSAIVNAVVSLANYSRMDITARAVGDTQGFTILPIAATSWGPAGSCMSISGGSTFMGCLPGTQVNFNVQFRNTTVMPTMVLQVFDFFIEVVGDGSIVLARVPVRIVVPPALPTYPASGFYLRDFDSTTRCAINERPVWGNLVWDVPSLPAGTGVRFELSSADSAAALPTATPIATVTVPAAGTGTRNVTTTLSGVGALARQYFLRVNAILTSSPDRLSAPVLRQVEVSYTCIPDE